MKLNGRWVLVFLLWLVCFLNYADRQLIFVLFPLLRKEFVLSNALLGLLGASFMGMYALTGPFAGWVCDRVSRRLLIVGALLFWSMATALCSLAHSYAALLVGIAMAGVGEAFYFPAAMSLIGDYHAADTRSRAMSIHQSGVYLGSIAGGWMSGWLGQHIGWRVSFRWFGAIGIVFGLVLALVLREPRRGLAEERVAAQDRSVSLWATVAALVRHPVARLLVLVFVGANFVAMVFSVWMPTYLFTRFHLRLDVVGLSSTFSMQMASVVGVLLGGFLADASARRRGKDAGARIRVMVCGLLLATPALGLSGVGTSLALVLGAMAGFGLGKGIYEASLWASLYDVIPVSRRGAAVGLMNSVGWLGAAVAQVVVGVASEHLSLGTCLSATAGIYAAIAGVLLYSARMARRMEGREVSAT